MKNDSVNDKINNGAVKGAVALKRGEGGIAFSLFMLLYFVVSLLVQGLLLMVGVANDGAVFYIIPPVVTYTVCFAFLLLFGKKKNKNVLFYCGLRKFSPIFAILSVTTALGLLFGLGFVNGLVAETLEKIGLKTQPADLPSGGGWLFVAYVFSLAIFPAVVEETAFRGVVFGENLKCGTVFAVVFSSLYFALYHCSATQLIYQFLCGAVFCLLVYYSGSAIPSVLAHFTNNFCVLLFSFLGWDDKIDFYSAPVILVGLALFTISVVLTVIIGEKSRKVKKQCADAGVKVDKDNNAFSENCENSVVLKSDLSKYNKKQERKYCFLFSSAGFVLCIVILISGLFA